ncbi:amidophosphoribosyltransferase [Vibrio azureus]|uniref:Putative competence protein ComF homolog n=1 Tax=Vibrio azureus NBRC 104587 TaxID=1219077 RepID=U3A6N2_9VIBR|nr:ComF family protein [Vibrio azureus]AUI85044.1 amidophosphoribosyltransferase [Vibrio azureus]GAD75681.1 putative competence protein ComF homolog [Vibrio azureus NBRC 104587]
MVFHQWQNIMSRMLSSQCGLCHFPLHTSQPSNPLNWCQHCINYLTVVKRCSRCGLALSPYDAEYSEQCGQCLAEPPPWQRLYTLGDYDFPLSGHIQRFKDHGEMWQVNALTQLLAERIEQPAPLITYVPLHWQRYLTRGFNQSHLLAQHLAKHLQVKLGTRVFRRVKNSPPQRGSNKDNRQNNLHQAFILPRKLPATHVAIVDDVVTTGSTVRQLSNLLLEVGVESIDIYCICRTPDPRSL